MNTTHDIEKLFQIPFSEIVKHEVEDCKIWVTIVKFFFVYANITTKSIFSYTNNASVYPTA